MDIQRDKIIPVFIEEEMKDSYIDYSMSVIVSRALPDVRDGLKPVHRRASFGKIKWIPNQGENNMNSAKALKKLLI